MLCRDLPVYVRSHHLNRGVETCLKSSTPRSHKTPQKTSRDRRPLGSSRSRSRNSGLAAAQPRMLVRPSAPHGTASTAIDSALTRGSLCIEKRGSSMSSSDKQLAEFNSVFAPWHVAILPTKLITISDRQILGISDSGAVRPESQRPTGVRVRPRYFARRKQS